jgi:hypothetical protein
VHRSSLSNAVFCLALVALVLSPSILSGRAVPLSYVPAVMPGQLAQYKTLKDSCQSSFPQLCQSLANSLNDTTYSAVQIVDVTGPSVALQLISIYNNGTGAHTGGLVNVATGASNITAFSMSIGDYFMLAGGLAYPNQIWNTPSARAINKTINEMVLGSMRGVNFLNFSLPGSYAGISYSQSLGFAFDQSSGLLIEINSSVRTTMPGILEFDFTIDMGDNNVWGNAHMPDFDLSADPTSVSATGSTSGNSAITLHRMYGFSATVSLSASASGGSVSCSFSPNSLLMGGSDKSTISCKGSPGTYRVLVEGNGGYSVHNTTITVTLEAGPIASRPASILSMPLIYGGIGVAAVAVLGSLLLLRRKSRGAAIAPSDASTLADQA